MKQFVMLLASVLLITSSAFGATAGDVNNDGSPDLKDVILSLQVSVGLTPTSYVYKKYDINGDGKIGLEEIIYDLQVVAGLRQKAAIWYKDADKDKYSDGTKQVSVTRPSAIYFEESELTATSGDADDNDPDIHPDASPKWTASDPTNSVAVSIPTDTSQEVVLEYSIPGMNTSEVVEDGRIYDILNIAGCSYTNEIGKPQMPVISRYVAVPAGAAVSAQVIDSVFRDIAGYNVYPVQEPMPDAYNVPAPPFTADTAFYQTNDFYPSDMIRIEDNIIIRGVSTVILQIHPVQYNPAKSKLRLYSKIRVRLTFSGGTRAVRDQRLRSQPFDQILDRLVLNKSLLFSDKDTRAAYDSGNSLLIITHPNFLDAANTLKDWKIKKGIHTKLRTTSETGNTASAIQGYIKTAYDTWDPPPTYVLLIGDAEFIPPHYVTKHPYSGSPHQGLIGTDLYYATVDGSDYFPDINIGRLSVDTSAQADKRVNDIIGYEKAVVTDSNFYKKAAVAAYFQHKSNGYDSFRFVQTAEDMAIFLSDAQYSVDRIYYTESDVSPQNWSTVSWNFGGPAGNPGAALPSYLLKPAFAWNGDRSAISSAINSGRFLVIHRDHGDTWGWSDPRYETGDVQALTNGSKLPVVWSINCQTGWFDNETDESGNNTLSDAVHFSEAWERNPNGGAVGVIAATRISYSGHNDRLVWGWADAIWKNFESYSPSDTPFNNPVWEMGPVLNYGKYYYATKEGESIHRKTEFELFHWFGDPTMQIWTELPQSLTVSHPTALPIGAVSVNVTVNDPDTLICVSKGGTILSRKAATPGTTTLSWLLPLEEGEKIDITVNKHNFRPYEGSAISGIVNFPDNNLEAVIREAINKPQFFLRIFVSDLKKLTVLNGKNKGIVNLEGLQYCTNLTELDLGYNQISDISILAGLTNLKRLELNANNISDASALSDLTNLTSLDLDNNQISDISALADLTKLTFLDIDYNYRISDISALAGMTKLNELQLDFNRISDISVLADLTNLKRLEFNGNRISDISPLVSNKGIDFGDTVIIYDAYDGGGNPLNIISCGLYIPLLQSRGVNVLHNCP